MNVRTGRGNLLVGTVLAAGLGFAAPAAAQSTTGYGGGYGSAPYDSGTYSAGTSGTMPAPTAPYSSSRYGAPAYEAPAASLSSSGGRTGSADGMIERQTVGGLMPGETAPPDAVRDPALWAQWQKHGQYEYDRGYEAGRRDAMEHMRSSMANDRDSQSPITLAPAPSGPQHTYTRMSERYDGPRADGPRYDGAPIGAQEPWWATSWDRMASSDWPRLSEEIRRRWPQLTGYDVERIRGERSMLLTVLQDRYNLSNERAHEQVVAWQQQLRG